MTRLLMTLCLLTAPFTVHSQQPAESHVEAAIELMEITRMDGMVEQTTDMMIASFANLSRQMGISNAEQPIFDRYNARVIALIESRMSWDQMEPGMVDAYVQVFSEDEIDQMIEFYASPVGQKMIASQPELMQKAAAMSQDMLKDVMPELQQIQREMSEELKAARAEAAADPA